MSTTTPAPTKPSPPPVQPKISLIAHYDRFARISDKFQSLVLLGIRGYIGYQCAFAGYHHLHNFNETVKNFEGWKVPMPQVSVAISGATEFVGGTLLVLGLVARLISIPLMINFAVAILVPSLADDKFRPLILHFWKNPDVIVLDAAFPFLMAAILIFFFGPGAFSIDGIVKYMHRKK